MLKDGRLQKVILEVDGAKDREKVRAYHYTLVSDK